MRAQLSADFMIVAAVVLLLLLLLFQLYSERADSTRILATRLAAQGVADDVARAIDHAWLAGNGSVAHVRLPDSLPNGLPYNLSVSGRRVMVEYAVGGGVRSAGAGLITANVTPASFVLSPALGGKLLNITSSNGTVKVVG